MNRPIDPTILERYREPVHRSTPQDPKLQSISRRLSDVERERDAAQEELRRLKVRQVALESPMLLEWERSYLTMKLAPLVDISACSSGNAW